MKILISGFFGEDNLGDEAILKSILRQLPDHCETVVTSSRILNNRAAIIRRRGLLSWPQFLRAAADSDKAIFTGGILQDWSWEGVTFFALRMIAASTFGCKPSLWGAGLGPLRRLACKKIAKKALSRCEYVWLRDRPSATLFVKLCHRSANIGTDWSWGQDIEWHEQASDNAPMALNLRQWPFFDHQSRVIKQLKYVDRKILGIAARNSDIDQIKQVAAKATIIKPDSFTSMSTAFSNCSFALCMRYHAALSAMRSGVALKLVGYDNKVITLAQEAGLPLLKNEPVTGFARGNKAFIDSQLRLYQSMSEAFEKFTTEHR